MTIEKQFTELLDSLSDEHVYDIGKNFLPIEDMIQALNNLSEDEKEVILENFK